MRISEAANLKGLAEAVVIQAIRDFVKGHQTSVNPKQHIASKLDAFEFLMSDALQFWADIAGMEHDANALLQNANKIEQELENYTRKRNKKNE